MTNSQQAKIDLIKSLFDRVETSENTYFVSVTFKEGLGMDTIHYHVFIGKRGAVRFVSAYRVFDEDHWRTLAKLAGQKLGCPFTIKEV